MNKSKTGYRRVKWLFGRYEKIPESWFIKKISDFATVHGRIGWKNLRADEYVESGPLMLSVWSLIENVPYGIDYNVGIKRLSKFRYDESPEIQLKDEDVLIAKDGDIGRTGFVKKLPERSTVNSHVVVVRIKNKQMHAEYLYHYIRFHPFQAYCKSYTSGTTVRLLTQKDLRNALIISPSMDEQQKIASILSGVDALIESTQKIIDKTERLKKGLMENLLTRGINHTKFKKVKWLFRKEIRVPKEWGVMEFGKISIIKRGASPRPINDPKFFGKGRGWIRIQDISKSNKYLIQTKDYLSGVGEMKSVAVNEGDIIMSIAATVGKPIIVKIKACIHDGFIVFSNLSDKMNNEFLYYLLTYIEHDFKNTGQHGTQSNINSGLVSKTKFLKPPLLEQQKIASILSGVDAYIQKNQQYKEKLKKLKKGLMQKLLTGQIRIKV